jgi:hypothetical protein
VVHEGFDVCGLDLSQRPVFEEGNKVKAQVEAVILNRLSAAAFHGFGMNAVPLTDSRQALVLGGVSRRLGCFLGNLLLCLVAKRPQRLLGFAPRHPVLRSGLPLLTEDSLMLATTNADSAYIDLFAAGAFLD